MVEGRDEVTEVRSQKREETRGCGERSKTSCGNVATKLCAHGVCDFNSLDSDVRTEMMGTRSPDSSQLLP